MEDKRPQIEDDLKILKEEYLGNSLFDYSHISNHIFQILKIKTTSNGRRHLNIKSEISQQPLIGSYSNSKLISRCPNPILKIHKLKMSSNGRQPLVQR